MKADRKVSEQPPKKGAETPAKAKVSGPQVSGKSSIPTDRGAPGRYQSIPENFVATHAMDPGVGENYVVFGHFKGGEPMSIVVSKKAVPDTMLLPTVPKSAPISDGDRQLTARANSSSLFPGSSITSPDD